MSLSGAASSGTQGLNAAELSRVIGDAIKQAMGHFCLRAKVQASMRKEKFSVIIKLHKLTAEVIDAGCHCKASSMSRCSHVIALLQALDDYVLLYGYTPPPCTSAVCQ
ncbi:hypothetical protein GE061_014409 [Apolygus lucorum]|uniref:SWIM-type domain-containing protein n=1 Tax=Apolygus lucorum TaxID=248454 RepID=A0A8S9XQF6_APOLU|nr:hypothetical protein GE061_014409 [Apolygus lucorum]